MRHTIVINGIHPLLFTIFKNAFNYLLWPGIKHVINMLYFRCALSIWNVMIGGQTLQQQQCHKEVTLSAKTENAAEHQNNPIFLLSAAPATLQPDVESNHEVRKTNSCEQTTTKASRTKQILHSSPSPSPPTTTTHGH